MARFLPLLLIGLPIAAMAADPGYRGIESTHQPIVGPGGAYVPRCPDWSGSNNGNTEGNGTNYGCATASNFALMIADPMDLLHGRGGDANSPDVATRAVKAWREIPPSSKQWQVTTSVSSKGAGQ
jgi:pilus assembly protein CpaD